jgi:opacity protein-like surface antigen
MKSTTQIISGIGVALLAGCAITRAADWSENLYLYTDIGAAFINNGPTTFRGVNSSGIPFQGKGHFRVDDGIRGDLALGYHLTESFALETEAGVTFNTGPGDRDTFYQIPIMLNAVYNLRLNDSWHAYLGAGAGGVISMTHSDHMDPAIHGLIVFEDSDWSPGYQAEAGIKYALSRHIEIDLGYKFLGVDEYNYRFGRFGAPLSEQVRVNNLFTHSGQVSFTWKF